VTLLDRIAAGCAGNEDHAQGPLAWTQLYPAECRALLDVITAAKLFVGERRRRSRPRTVTLTSARRGGLHAALEALDQERT
jgi:hypothetical protein